MKKDGIQTRNRRLSARSKSRSREPGALHVAGDETVAPSVEQCAVPTSLCDRVSAADYSTSVAPPPPPQGVATVARYSNALPLDAAAVYATPDYSHASGYFTGLF